MEQHQPKSNSESLASRRRRRERRQRERLRHRRGDHSSPIREWGPRRERCSFYWQYLFYKKHFLITILFPGTPNGAGRRFLASPKLYRSPWLQHQRRSHLISNDANANGNGRHITGAQFVYFFNFPVPPIYRSPTAEH